MLRIGLTGGLASGKSFVGGALAQLGCFVIDADEIGHRVLEPGGEAVDAVVAAFGREILDAQGAIDRRELGARVFGKPDLLQKLSALVHPPVRARIQRALDDFAAREPRGIAIVEAAILVETGSYRNQDGLIVAACRPEQQIERAMVRDQLTREQVMDRLARQMPLEEKLKYADYVVDTSGSKEHTLEQTRALFQSLQQLTRR